MPSLDSSPFATRDHAHDVCRYEVIRTNTCQLNTRPRCYTGYKLCVEVAYTGNDDDDLLTSLLLIDNRLNFFRRYFTHEVPPYTLSAR